MKITMPVRILQANLRGSKRAQDVVFQTVAEMKIDILILSEYYRSGNTGWYCDANNRAALVMISPIAIDEEVTSDPGFKWIEAGGNRFYACYWSPNTTTAEYENFVMRLETSARTATGEVLMAGDFNAQHQDWGSTINNVKGEILSEMTHAIGLIACNVGHKPTFQRELSESIIDITFVSSQISTKIQDWKVLDELTASDHNYIYFALEEPNIVMPTKPQGWQITKLDVKRLEAAIDDMTLTTATDTDVETRVQELAESLRALCDKTMPKRRVHGKRKSVHWWNPEIGKLRKVSNQLRRKYQRKLRRAGPDNCQTEKNEAKIAKRNLYKAIKQAKEQSWRKLCEEVENDPWGLPYKLVTGKLVKNSPIPGINKPGRVEEIIKTLFPVHPPRVQTTRETGGVAPQVTKEEVQTAARQMKSKKAPGPDGVPTEVFKTIARKKPSTFTEIFNQCINQRKFPIPWKVSRLVLLRKGNKPVEDPSSYRPLCMINTIGKLFEKIIDNRIRNYLEEQKALAPNQYGFRKHKSTIDAINHVRSIALENRSKSITGILTIDVKNAFNTANWGKILEAAMEKCTPAYLCEILEEYLKDRRVMYTVRGKDADMLLTSGVPQGSILGPTLWNILYDGLLRLQMPHGVEIIAFADDVALVAKSDITSKVEELLEKAAENTLAWLEHAGLEVAIAKSETMLITRRRTNNTIRVTMRGIGISSTRSIKYLGLQLDSKLNFNEHARIASSKASKTVQSLARLMPNVGASKATKRRLLATVVMSQMLYGAQSWADMMQPGGWTILTRCQRKILLRVATAYRTTSTDALQVITGISPLKLTAEERKDIYEGKANNVDPILNREAAKTKKQGKWQQQWNTTKNAEWTRRLIKNISPWVNRRHGQTNYRLTQALTGHGCFQAYLFKYKRTATPICRYCNNFIDDAEHTIFRCEAWEEKRRVTRALLGNTFEVDNMIENMLKTEKQWNVVSGFINEVMLQKEEDERQLQRQEQYLVTL